MALMHARIRFGAAILGSALAVSACTVHKQDVPALTGPSELGISITIAASPNVLTQDGASQSIVTITARNNNGQPLANLSLRTEISVGGAITDFGRLSARNVVTDSTGRATVVYTAPPAPAVTIGSGTNVDIVVTPAGTNADNDNPRVASIRLVPLGVIGAPVSPFVPGFTPPAPNVGDAAFFTATVTDPATSGDATSQIASFQWSFGDGGTATGRAVTHTFTQPGTFPVTLTITDALGRTNFLTVAVTVAQGQLPTAAYVTSPLAPIVDQAINFNATGSTAAPRSGQQVTFDASATQAASGRTIVSYSWSFGNGNSGTGQTVTTTFTTGATPTTYNVLLTVTDSAGKTASKTLPITINP
jgi:PKD repeat protein